MKIQLLDKAKKKKFISRIEDLGINKIPQLLVKSGRERVRAYSGSLSKDEIMKLWSLLPIEGVGLYVGKDTIDRHGVKESRLSLDGLHTWKDQITGNIFELNEELEEKWFKGKNLEVESEEFGGTFVAVKSKSSGDFIGTGKFSKDGKVLHNFLPKERRRKSQVI